MKSFPPLPCGLSKLSFEERRQEISVLASLFIPMPFMYAVYDTLYRAIRTTYTTKTELESIRQINALAVGKALHQYATQADTGSVLGVPGIGKTSVIRRSLALLPQVIEHTEYHGKPFFCKQVLYLHVKCPSDCSVKTLAMNLIAALDKAIGSDYLIVLLSLRSAAASAIAAQIKILCMTHHVGLILVDEIQKRGTPGVRIDEREISVQAVQTSGKCNCWYNYASHSCTADQMVSGDVFHDKR